MRNALPRNPLLCHAVWLAFLFLGCGSEQLAEPEPVTAVVSNPDADRYVLDLPDWEVPDTTTEPPKQLEPEFFVAPDPAGTQFVCSVTEIDLKKNFNDLIAVGANAGVLWPGALIQGNSVKDGAFTGIPLARSPITISIDLAIENPVRRIEHPTSASAQRAIAELQREADFRLGVVDVVPARINFESEEAFSLEQMMMSAGISVSASAPLQQVGIPASAGGGFSFDASAQRVFRQHSIVVKLFQPMYTISFADEEKPSPGAYFAPSVTTEDLMDQQERGVIGPANLPTYVKSVTYGRLMFFTMTNNEESTAAEMRAAMHASFQEMTTGTEGEIESELALKFERLRRNSTINMVAFGGSQEDAIAAVREGDLRLFFTASPATVAIPISYRINNLKNGSVAVIGDATKYKVRECQPGAKLRFYVTFHGVTDITTPVPCTLSDLEANVNLGEFQGVYTGPFNDDVQSQVVINVNEANTGFAVQSELLLDNGDIKKQIRSEFVAPFLFPSNPYQFDHILTIKPSDVGPVCTAQFDYTIRKENVFLAPSKVTLGSTRPNPERL